MNYLQIFKFQPSKITHFQAFMLLTLTHWCWVHTLWSCFILFTQRQLHKSFVTKKSLQSQLFKMYFEFQKESFLYLLLIPLSL